MMHVRFLLLFLVPATAFADAKSEAKVHIEAATKLHATGKFTEALEELRLAYAIDPQPELLYATGQVHVQLGNCPRAIAFYERFLASKPAAVAAAAAKEAIETCKSAPPPEPEPVPVPVPVPVTTAPEPPQPPPPQPEQPPSAGTPWYRDVIGDVLVSGGVVASVMSVVFYQQMSSKLDDADAAMSYDAHQAARDDAASKRNLSLAFGAGGVVLIGAGVVRYMIRDRGDRRSSVAVTPTTDGGLITMMGRF